MNFIFIFIVGIIAVQQLPNKSTQITENKELKLIVANPISEKKIEQIVKLVPPKQEVVQKESKPIPPKQEVVQKEAKPVPPKQEVVQKEAKPAPPKQEVVQKEAKPVPPKQEVVQKEAKPVPSKQEVVNQENAKSKSLIEKAVSYFSQYYLIGLVLAAIAYIYFRTRKKITLKEILNKEEFKSEPSVEPTTTEEGRFDSQSPESSDEEEKK
jgi:type IV secretory pathway VirB10-like protein